MESSARMRQCLRRNYKGSDHFGAAANFEDHMDMKHDRENVIDPSNAPILAAEAISMGGINEEDEQADIDNLVESEAIDMEQNEKNQPKSSGMAEQPLQASTDYIDTPIANNQDVVQGPSAVAPGYVPSELDERIVLELSSSMVRPLRVVRGTFQVSFMYPNHYTHSYFLDPNSDRLSFVLAGSLAFNHLTQTLQALQEYTSITPAKTLQGESYFSLQEEKD